MQKSLTLSQREYTARGLITFPMNISVGKDGKKRLLQPPNWPKITKTTPIVEGKHNAFGALCGLNGIVVIDLDILKPGEDSLGGPEIWGALMKNYGTVRTFCVRTASGGYHYYFNAGEELALVKKQVGITVKGRDGAPTKAKIDLLTRGAYAIGCGSVNPVHGKSYTLEDSSEIVPLPEWLAPLFHGGYIEEFVRGEYRVVGEEDIEEVPKTSVISVGSGGRNPPCNITEGTMAKFLDMIDILAREYDPWRDVLFSLHNMYESEVFYRLAHHFSSSCRSKYNKARVDEFITNISVPEYGYRLNNLLELCKKYKLNDARNYLEEIVNESRGENTIENARVDIPTFDTTLDGDDFGALYRYIDDLNRQSLMGKEYAKLLFPRLGKVLAYIIKRKCYAVKFLDGDIQLMNDLPKQKCSYMILGEKNNVTKTIEFKDLVNKCWSLVNKYDDVTFLPFPPNGQDPTPPHILNLWVGFKAKLLPRDKVDVNKCAIHLRHVEEVICNDDKDEFQHVIGNYLGELFRDPGDKKGIALQFLSTPGCGKGQFIDGFLIPLIFGSHIATVVQGMDKITQRFNAILMNKLLISVNELPVIDIKAGRHSQFEIMKALITDMRIQIEIKGGPVMEYPVYARYIFSANEKISLKIEAKDRRYSVIECSEKYLGNMEYFNRLREASTQEAANHFFSYCYYKQSVGNPRLPIMTNAKMEIIQTCANSPRRFLLVIKELMKQEPEYKYDGVATHLTDFESSLLSFIQANGDGGRNIGASQLFEKYKEFCEEDGERFIYNNRKFGEAIKGHITKRKITRGFVYDLTSIVG